MSDRRQQMLDLVRKAHDGQTRNGGRLPYWMHVQSVAQILEWVIEREGEIEDSQLIEDLYLAALGHDLYEDTKVAPATVRDHFGERVDQWIRAMTNDGDQDRAAYLGRMAGAPEEVRLIKLADMIDNTASVAYGIHDVGLEWAVGTYLVIVSEMAAVMRSAPFDRHPRTAGALRSLFEFHHQRLLHTIEMHQRDAPATAAPSGGRPAPRKISSEAWKRALDKTRQREREEGERVFKGGKPFMVPDKDDD